MMYSAGIRRTDLQDQSGQFVDRPILYGRNDYTALDRMGHSRLADAQSSHRITHGHLCPGLLDRT